MTIKKLENKNFAVIIMKTVLIVSLILVGLLINKKIFTKKNSSSKVLSVESKLKKTAKDLEKSDAVKNIIDQAQSSVNNVLGTTTKMISDAVSSSTQTAEDFLIKNTVGKIMEQLNKLPEKEKEEIKKEICK